MERKKVTLISTVIGMVLAYGVVSPFAMVFFHLSHSGIDPQLFNSMQHSLWGSIIHSFSSQLATWWMSFLGLGALFGAGVGSILYRMEEKEKKIERHARALAQANAKLENAYRELVQADKMATLGLMAGTIIHDITNYLTIIQTIVECEMMNIPEKNWDLNPWNELCGHVRRVKELCDSVRRFSRKTTGKLGQVDVHKILHESFLIMRKALAQRQIQLTEALEAQEHIVEGNHNDLLQVFVNLIQNALDALEPHGSITVRTRNADSGLEVFFTDTGSGIPAQLLPRIFEAFFTTKQEDKGTGLGLAICKRIIENHKGRIDAESREGKGTTFRIHLPLSCKGGERENIVFTPKKF